MKLHTILCRLSWQFDRRIDSWVFAAACCTAALVLCSIVLMINYTGAAELFGAAATIYVLIVSPLYCLLWRKIARGSKVGPGSPFAILVSGWAGLLFCSLVVIAPMGVAARLWREGLGVALAVL